jgi:hypothetical protein
MNTDGISAFWAEAEPASIDGALAADPNAELRVIGDPISDCGGRPLTSTVIPA